MFGITEVVDEAMDALADRHKESLLEEVEMALSLALQQRFGKRNNEARWLVQMAYEKIVRARSVKPKEERR